MHSSQTEPGYSSQSGDEAAKRLKYATSEPIFASHQPTAFCICDKAELPRPECADICASSDHKLIEEFQPERTIQREDVPHTRPSLERTAKEPLKQTSHIIYLIVGTDAQDAISTILTKRGRKIAAFKDTKAFLSAYIQGNEACLLLDASLPGMSAISLLNTLRTEGDLLPTILLAGPSDVATAVTAMRAGASDFIEKPVERKTLLKSVNRALSQSHDLELSHCDRDAAAETIAGLTARQFQIMQLVLAGHPSKNIAADLMISQRTVENHRA